MLDLTKQIDAYQWKCIPSQAVPGLGRSFAWTHALRGGSGKQTHNPIGAKT